MARSASQSSLAVRPARASARRAGRDRLDRGRGLPRRRVPADAVDARAVDRRRRVRRRYDRRAACWRSPSPWASTCGVATATRAPRALRAALRALVDPPELDGAARASPGGCCSRGSRCASSLLGLDVLWQPLYPWDAWTQWATKARVWYELGRIVPFANADDMVRGRRRRVFRCGARSPADAAAAAGVGVHRARALGRFADELAVVADGGRARGRRVRRASIARDARARRARRDLSRRIAAARQRPRRARRLRRSADGGVLRLCGAALLRFAATRRPRRCGARRCCSRSRARRSRIPGSAGPRRSFPA